MFDNDLTQNRRIATQGVSSPKAKKAPEVAANGLRFKTKPAGSPFSNQSGGFGSTMSCFRCGQHFPASELETKKYLGKSQKVCKGGCKK